MRSPMLRGLLVMAGLLVASPLATFAQHGGTSPDQPADASSRGTISGQAPDAIQPPPPRAALPEIKDADVAAASGALRNSWVSTQQGTGNGADVVPPLLLSLARVDITGLDNAHYFELSRADSPESPFRQCILHVYKKGDGLRLRVFDFTSPSQGNALVGMWIAPDAFPPMTLESLVVSADLTLTKDSESYRAQTEGRAPTTRHGAWEIESSITFGKDGLTLSDKGYDATGKQIFGNGAAGTTRLPIEFKPFNSAAKKTVTPEGLVIIDLAPLKPGAITLQTGMSGVVNFSGYLLDGTLVGTTRQEGGKPQAFTLPGRMIKGWNDGMPGLTEGAKRRLVVPPALGFGVRGSSDGRIPPSSWLAFEIELVHLDPPPPGTEPAPAAAPAAAPPPDTTK